MKVDVIRYSTSSESTLGLLMIDGAFACYTLEDEYREQKVAGETRIPAGTFELELRKFGGHHEKYLKKYGADFHHGMLQVMEVPNFTDILIHKGNTDDHTAGCLLVGDGANNNQTMDGFISNSGLAYERIYPRIASELLSGKKVFITYRDTVAVGIAPPTPEAKTPRKVNTDRLYLREVPQGLERAILLKDCPLELQETRNDWSKVKLEGWVSSRFLL